MLFRTITSAALAAGVLAGLAACGGNEDVVDASNSRPVAAATGDVASQFGVLRRARNAEDALPADSAPILAGPSKTQGWDLTASRVLRSGTKTAWLVKGTSELCLISANAKGYGWSCSPTASIAAGTSVLGGSRRSSDESGKPQTLTALVPDGVSDVRVVSADGGATDVVVKDNYAAVDAAVGDRLVATIGGQEQTLAQ